jgi:hypothetical protein
MKQYVQCRMRRGTQETTAWIEERGAKVGAKVELKPTGELWEVRMVGTSLPEDLFKEHQKMHRKSLPSVEPMS